MSVTYSLAADGSWIMPVFYIPINAVPTQPATVTAIYYYALIDRDSPEPYLHDLCHSVAWESPITLQASQCPPNAVGTFGCYHIACSDPAQFQAPINLNMLLSTPNGGHPAAIQDALTRGALSIRVNYKLCPEDPTCNSPYLTLLIGDTVTFGANGLINPGQPKGV